MRGDGLEVEISGDHEDYRFDGIEASEAASTTLGRLEQAVNGLQKPIGLARLSPGDDALQGGADNLGYILHRLDLGAHPACAPMLQHGANGVDLFAIKNLAQLLFVDPSPSGTLDGYLGNQSIHIGCGLGFD